MRMNIEYRAWHFLFFSEGKQFLFSFTQSCEAIKTL
jgi:hypothetical protein